MSLAKIRYVYCICVTVKVENWSCFYKIEQLSKSINYSVIYTSTKITITCLFELSPLYFHRGVIA